MIIDIKIKILFTKLSKLRLPINVNNNINKYLKKIDKYTKKNFFNTTLLLGIVNDSNLNSRANDDKFYIPKFNITTDNKVVGIHETLHQEMLVFDYRYKNKNISFINNILFYNKQGFKNKEQNVQFFAYTPSISYTYSKHMYVNYSLFIDTLKYKAKSYMTSYGINPKLTYLYSKNTMINFILKYQNKKYTQKAHKNRDSKYLKLSTNIRYNINKIITLLPSVFYEQDKRDGGLLTNIDFSAISCAMGINYKINKVFDIGSFIRYKSKKFDITNTFYKIKQINTEYKYSINAKYEYSNNTIFQTNLEINQIKSNINAYSYNKNIISFNIIRKF